jgi:RNA polymerase sigma factor (sigma-70 family)
MTPEDEELYRKHGDRLLWMATALVGPSDAEDVFASAIVRAMGAPGWGGVEHKEAYLHRTVVNEAKRLFERRSNRERREHLWASPERLYPTEVRPDVQEAVASLSVQQRAVVFLTYWADLTGRDVAVLLDVSEGTVRQHLARAKATLRRMIDE